MSFLRELFERALEKREVALNEYSDVKYGEEAGVGSDGFQSREEMNELFEMRDPNTGERYNIPYLTSSDPGYFFKYVSYMRIKKQNPATFERILGWE